MSIICYTVLVSLIYIIIIVWYIFSIKGERENSVIKKANLIFSIAVSLVAMSSLIGCIYFMVAKDAKEYFAVYLAFLIIYVLIANMYKTNKCFDDYVTVVFKRVGYLVIIESISFLITIILEGKIQIDDLVTNRVVIVILICSLLYAFKIILSLMEKDNYKRFIDLMFNISISIYICLYSVFYLIQDNIGGEIGKIINSISIIVIVLDKMDDILQYFNCDNKIGDDYSIK